MTMQTREEEYLEQAANDEAAEDRVDSAGSSEASGEYDADRQSVSTEEETLIRKLGKASGAADRPMGEAEPPAPFLITALSYVGVLTVGVLLLALLLYLWR